MAPQVTRLALAFGALVSLFLGFRSIAVPEAFGTEGFHRVEAPAEVAAAPLRHAGKEACLQCHDLAEATTHFKAGVACESCHGPSLAHVEDFEKAKPRVPGARADCTRCHAAVTARRASFPQIDPAEHNPESRCVDCHVIHESVEEE